MTSIPMFSRVKRSSMDAEGNLVYPWWVERVTNGNGETVALPRPRPPRPTWERELADELRELLVGVTARGTAKSAFRDHRGRPMLGSIMVSGKTGSLSGTDPKGRYEWFIGVAPAERPSLAIAAVVVNGPLWWRNASEVAAEGLHGIFCADGTCRAEAGGRLRSDAVARQTFEVREGLAEPVLEDPG